MSLGRTVASMRTLLGALVLALLSPASPVSPRRPRCAAAGAATSAPPVAQRPPLDRAAAMEARQQTRPQATLQARALPRLVVRRQVTGLDHPWDVQPIGQRPAAVHAARPGDPLGVGGRRDAPGGVPQRPGLGVGRDRPDGARRSTPSSTPTAASTRARAASPAAAVTTYASSPGASTRRRPRRPGSRRWSAASPPAPAGTAAAGSWSPAAARCSSAPATRPRAPTRRTSTRSAARPSA